MEGYSISFTLGKASAAHGGNVKHNNREFIADNVDNSKTKNNVQYVSQDIEEAFHELFDDAVYEYNQKQSRPCRCINNYYEHIRDGKKEEMRERHSMALNASFANPRKILTYIILPMTEKAMRTYYTI